MQVPERSALIGGSILLASILIFTLKSQASNIVPQISHSINGIYRHIGDAEHGDFDNGYHQAQKNGWTTGTWGTSKYYIDDDMNMYVSSGQLQSPLDEITNGNSTRVRSLNFTGNVALPADSRNLFIATAWQNNQSLITINGLNKLDTSQVNDVDGLFADDAALRSLDLSSWDTSNFKGSMNTTFYNLRSLKDLNVTHWNTSQATYMGDIFSGDDSLSYLDLSSWDTSHVPFMATPDQLKSDPAHPGIWIQK